jgi:hypothetical protein
MNPVNMTTELRERSLSPSNNNVRFFFHKIHTNLISFPSISQQSNRMYKTAKYEYSTSSSHNNFADRKGNLNEINKLDTLLSDLEKERTSTLDRCEYRNLQLHKNHDS